jgi:hypothetical protein
VKRRLLKYAAVAVTALAGVGAGTTIPNPTTPGAKPQVIYVRNTSALADSEVKNAIPAFQTAIDKDFEPLWHVTAKLKFVSATYRIPLTAQVIWIQDKMDMPDALAYHGLEGGVPFARIGYGVSIAYGYSWTVGFTHELWEMLADPSINRTIQDPTGRIWANETADAVEAEKFGYNRLGANGKPVLISDFITDAWYGANTAQQYDFTHSITRPYQVLEGGYAQWWDGINWNVIQGSHALRFWAPSSRGS